MRATVMHGAGDLRTETVPDGRPIEPTDAVVGMTRACVCGSDLWPYNAMEHSETGRRMGHEAIGVIDAVGTDVRTMTVGDLVVMPFAYSDSSCIFCHEAFTPHASTEGSSVQEGTLMEHRPKQSGFRRQTEPCSCCRSAKTTY